MSVLSQPAEVKIVNALGGGGNSSNGGDKVLLHGLLLIRVGDGR